MTVLNAANDAEFNCDKVENSGPVCFTKLGETIDSSWQQMCDEVRRHIAHWHCCTAQGYWTDRIAGRFDASLADFHGDTFVRLADVLRECEQGQALLRCQTAAELEKHLRRCILKSLERVRGKYRRDRERGAKDVEISDDDLARDPPPDTWYIRHEIVDCLKRVDAVERWLLYEVRVWERSQKDVAAELGKHPATIGRWLEKAEEMLKQCLLEKGIEP